MGNIKRTYRFSGSLSNIYGSIQVSMRENNDKFLSSVTGNTITASPGLFFERICYFPQAFISGSMSIGIIKFLKKIDITNN